MFIDDVIKLFLRGIIFLKKCRVLRKMFLNVVVTVRVCATDAVRNVVQFMGLQACERSDKVAEGKSSHTLYLAGVYRGGHDVLVRAKMALGEHVTMQLTVRSEDASAAEVLTAAVGC